MSAAMYRTNFWLMLIQSLVNSAMGIFCVAFIYGGVDSVAGWNKNEMIILICTSQIVNQIYRGVIHWNQNRFIASVGDGSFDKMLIRPLSVLFQANTGGVDISGIASINSPLCVLLYQATTLGVEANAFRIALYMLYIFNGVLILSSFMLLLYSSAFMLIKADGFNNIYYLMMDIADKPKEMFQREFLFGFIFLIPAIPLANAPASILLGKASTGLLVSYLAAGAFFAFAAGAAVRLGLSRYSSASS
jgi:ABC-2 type transport system permease protein